MAIQLLNGLVYGALLFTVASGLALMFVLRRIVNFAHGSLYMLGAYVCYSVSKPLGFWTGRQAMFPGTPRSAERNAAHRQRQDPEVSTARDGAMSLRRRLPIPLEWP